MQQTKLLCYNSFHYIRASPCSEVEDPRVFERNLSLFWGPIPAMKLLEDTSTLPTISQYGVLHVLLKTRLVYFKTMSLLDKMVVFQL